ncbi:MAG: hypothetical protein ABIU11_03480 [Chitinophagaceae bacterium]
MKKIFVIVSLFFTAIVTNAQMGSWKIRVSCKTILATSNEDEKINTKKITAAQWKKSGNLEIIFKETDPDTWRRSFLLFDAEDNQLLSKKSTNHAKISLASLRKLFAGKKEIRIYTVISPLDPNIAIRVPRVHLCTLQLP